MASDQAAQLCRSVFLFGAVGHGPYGFMTFAEDGRVTTYENANESHYRLEAGRLSFLDGQGRETSSLVALPDQPLVFRPHGQGNHYLEPVLTLDAPPQDMPELPPVLVNTLPKSGTYMMAQALKDVGYAQVDLHLSARFLHDNRGIAPEDIHWQPQQRSVAVPARAAAALLRPGEFMVAHIDEAEELRRIERMDLELLNVVRCPYRQILSMMKFRLKKVKPSERDLIWQGMAGADRVKAFVISHPVEYWLEVSRMLTAEFPCLRYEDLRAGVITEGAASARLTPLLAAGLKTAIGKRTPTLMQQSPQEDLLALKDPAVLAYLAALGLEAHAAAHWPDHPFLD